MWTLVIFGIFGLLGSGRAQTLAPCVDIDTNACREMAVERTNMCSDMEVIKACRRYCNLCPLHCYNCNTTTDDMTNCARRTCAEGQTCVKTDLQSFVDGHREFSLFCEAKQYCDHFGAGRRGLDQRDVTITCSTCHNDLCNVPVLLPVVPVATTKTHTGLHCYNCNTTTTDLSTCSSKMCAAGQACIKKDLKSFTDGHREFSLFCESKQYCDRFGAPMVIGRRGAQERDVTVTCTTCHTDLCNIPVLTHVTTHNTTGHGGGCRKDINVLVDESKHNHAQHINSSDINAFLKSIVHNMTIGKYGSLMNIQTFGMNTTHNVVHLRSCHNRTCLLHAIKHANFMDSHGGSDLNTAIDYLVNQKPTREDRTDPGDVAIIVTSHDANGNYHTLTQKLSRQYSDVIVIGLSRFVNDGDLRPVATDSAHEFRFINSSHLQQIVPQVVSLICK